MFPSLPRALVIIYIFVLKSFIVTCVLYFYLTNHKVLGKLPIRDLNNRAIEELLQLDLAKTQCTRDDEEPYFCINVDQYR